MLCSSSLLFLQRDRLLLSSLSKHNHLVPTFMIINITLLLSSIYDCRLWTAVAMGYKILGIIEMMLITVTLPVWFILWGVLWDESILLRDRIVVFTMPLFSLLLPLGSTMQTQFLGACGLAVGYWLTMYKLPLQK